MNYTGPPWKHVRLNTSLITIILLLLLCTSGYNYIGTHLIQNVQVFSHDHNILVSGNLVNADIANITALGFLAIAYSNSDPISPYYEIATPLSDRLYAEVLFNITLSPEHQYRVSVFSIGHHGLPFNESVHLAQPAVGNTCMLHD